MKRASLLLALLIGVGCGEPRRMADSKIQPPDLQAERATVVKSNTEFAVDLYHLLRKQPGNVLVSPHSIATALAMTYAGAGGQSAEQMARTLHLTLEPDRLPLGVPAIAAHLTHPHP